MEEEVTSPPEPTSTTQQPAVDKPLPPKVNEPTEPAEPPKVLKKADDRIAQATALVIRQEAATAALKEQLDRQEAMNVETTLGGKTEAGQTIKVEMAPEEYAKKVMANDIKTTTT